MGHWGWVAGVTAAATFHFVTEVSLSPLDGGWVALHALGNALAIYIPKDLNNIGSNASFLLYDITNRTSPSLQSTTGTSVIGATAPGTCKIIGSNLYLATFGKMQVWDISNLASPSQLGNLLSTGITGMPHAFELSGSFYTVADRTTGGNEIVSVYDETTPASITLAGSTGNLVTGGNYTCGYGTTFYTPNDIPDTMYVIDCSTPSSPTTASTIALTDTGDISSASATGFFFQRDGTGYIRAYDVSNIASPSFGSEFIVDTLDGSPFAVGSFTDGTYLYLVNFGSRNSVILKDATNLASVSEIGNVVTQHDPTSSNPVCTIGITTYVITNDGTNNYLEIYQYS